jgi:hypothetical protein
MSANARRGVADRGPDIGALSRPRRTSDSLRGPCCVSLAASPNRFLTHAITTAGGPDHRRFAHPLIAEEDKPEMTWTLRDLERDRETTDAIDRHDDRSAAILAASFLEDRLTRGIKARLIPDAKAQKKFLEYPGPISTFAAKIDLAYLMGILDPGTTQRLHVIREVRNIFAHELGEITFNGSQIEKLCKKLYRIEALKWLKAQFEGEEYRQTHQILQSNGPHLFSSHLCRSKIQPGPPT